MKTKINLLFLTLLIGYSSAYAEEADWNGLRKDSYLTVGYQLLAAAAIYYMPQDISGWEDKDKNIDYRISQYKKNIRYLRWDTDTCLVNCVGHPYFGAAYYVVARQRNFDRWESFTYAFTMSAIFEYGVEAFFEKPSIQDLIITPVGGMLVGEYFYKYRKQLKREIAERGASRWWESSALFLTDPIGSLNRQIYSAFGVKTETMFLPVIGKNNAQFNLLVRW